MERKFFGDDGFLGNQVLEHNPTAKASGIDERVISSWNQFPSDLISGRSQDQSHVGHDLVG
jgi:hypothetical protein